MNIVNFSLLRYFCNVINLLTSSQYRTNANDSNRLFATCFRLITIRFGIKKKKKMALYRTTITRY